MTTLSRSLVVLGVIAVAAGCGGGVKLVPHALTSARPTKSAAATATPAAKPSASGTLTVAQITAALQNVETSYQSLPHTSLASDLSTLATQMVSSGAYKAAAVVPGGIAATLPDGTPVLVFADRVEDLGGPSASERSRASGRIPLDAALSAPNAHEIALFVNETDTSGAFVPTRQFAFGNAFTQRGFGPSTGYGVDAVDMSLENLIALGSGHPFDFLGIATHGMIGSDPDNPLATNTYYAWLSTTPVTETLIQQYQADYNAGNLINAIYLTVNKSTVSLNTFAFTPTFLTEHVTFNPGAIVDNQSCWGQNPLIASTVQGILQGANVGRYLGWTKEVAGNDADETDAFIFDRLLGEQSPSPGLGGLANQRTPPQRPFPLDQIETALASETRNSPIQAPQSEPYTQSNINISVNASAPPIADGTLARLVVTDFGGESVADPPIEYGLPSISQMYVTENSTSGTLTILGNFPAVSGNAQITDSSGTYPLVPTAWSTSQITATLAANGNGSAGSVLVFYGTPSSDVIGSNPVPLTQWGGKLIYNENDQIPSLGADSGSGTGTIQVTYNLTVRADVHPTVPTIDTSPEPQNLTFTVPEGGSTANVTAFNGTFTSDEEGDPPAIYTATFSLAPNAPAMVAAPPPIATGTFDVGAYQGEPAPCNNAFSGPQGGPGNVFCPVAAFASLDAGTCSDDDSGNLCSGSLSPSVNFGLPPGVGHVGGQLTLTMDPSTYAITVTSTAATFTSTHFAGSDRSATASMTGTFNAPAYPPTSTTPAFSRRAPPS